MGKLDKDTNRVDLADINNKKSKINEKSESKLPQRFGALFKKKDSYKRDNEGKFTSGSGGLKRMGNNLSLKRAVPLVIVIALVGGFFVYKSFAASFVTEMYVRCFNQEISSGANYNYWANRLKSESKNTVWAAFVAASGKPCNHPYPKPKPNTGGGGGGGGGTTKTKKPASTVDRVNETKNLHTLSQALRDNAKKSYDTVKSLANKKIVSDADLRNIQARQKEVNDWRGMVNAMHTKASTYANQESDSTRKAWIVSMRNAIKGFYDEMGFSAMGIHDELQKATDNNKRAKELFGGGYSIGANGMAFPNDCNFTSGVSPSIADQVAKLCSAAKNDGVNLGGHSWRDSSEQIRLRKAHCGTSHYAIYEMPSGNCRPPTARPGTSNHEKGLAIDFSNCSQGSACFNWLSANASKYGLYNLPSESWHWSVNGG